MKINVLSSLPKTQENVILSHHTTFKIGGAARYFFAAIQKKDLIKAIKITRKLNLPFFILGGGSNILVSDKGFKGLVIETKNRKIEIEDNKLYAEAGVKLFELVKLSLNKKLSGLEWAAGIPGTVGGAIYGNSGAFGKSIGDIIENVEVLDHKTLKIKKLKNNACNFRYKKSIFSKNKNLIILSTKIQLKRDTNREIKRKVKGYLNYRKNNYPLNFPSAGCIFKNIKYKIKNEKLLRKFPEFREFNKKGMVRVSYLIEKCGLKGKRIGNAQISKKHANFIINLDNAKAKNVIKLVNLIKKRVRNKFKINLEEEIQYLGF